MASIGGVPINEFTTEGYFSCVFPTHFSTGAGDFSGQRQNQVTIGNYFKHLMMYDDNRFAKHPRFCFFALNTEMRWCAVQTGRVYVFSNVCSSDLLQSCVHSIREYQNFPNNYVLFTKVSMHLGISHSLCSAVHNYDALCRRSSRSPIMLSILLVIRNVSLFFVISCRLVVQVDSLCRRSSRSPIMLSILLVIRNVSLFFVISCRLVVQVEKC